VTDGGHAALQDGFRLRDGEVEAPERKVKQAWGLYLKSHQEEGAQDGRGYRQCGCGTVVYFDAEEWRAAWETGLATHIG